MDRPPPPRRPFSLCVLGIVLGVAVLAIVNAIYFLPEPGFVFNGWIALSGFIGAPLVYLALGLLVHLVGLSAKAANGNLIAQLFLPVMINVIIQITLRDVVGASSWLFFVLNIGLAAVMLAVTLALRSRLTPEHVILSS